MAFCRVAKQGVKAIMSGQRGIAGLFLCVGSETFFDRYLGIVEDDLFRCSAKELEHLYERVEKTLFVLSTISDHKGGTARAESGTK